MNDWFPLSHCMFSKPTKLVSTRTFVPFFHILYVSLGHTLDKKGTEMK